MAETYTFQAEIQQLLHTLVHSLYKDQEIFLRELISNSSDALSRVQFELLTNQAMRDPDLDFEIRIRADKEAKTLSISDTGIGMTREEMIENLGTISKSGIRAFLDKVQSSGSKEIVTDLIGQFGVGFYSVFMVADEVHVISRSAEPDAPAIEWISKGEENYEIQDAERETRGTDVVLYLKEDAEEFLEDYRLKQVIGKHSNYVAFPIYVGDDEEPTNAQQAIWRRSSNEVEEEEYGAFYRSLTMDFKEPLHWIHTQADAPVQYYSLLYIPASGERNVFSSRQEPGLQLYARKVLIQDYNTDLLPEYLNFVQGVVDSEDIPLNVSRETVQANRLMANLNKVITGRVLRELNSIAKDDPQKYATFWGEFGPYIKQGVMTDIGNRERLLPLLRFYSTHREDEWTSLADYVERMQEVKGQEEIYYVLGDSKAVARRSPHLDPFRERGIEVLYFTETVDSFLINSLYEFNDHKLRNIDDESLDLSEVGELVKPAEEVKEPLPAEELEILREHFADVLGERVKSVRVSKVLTGQSPARLVSPEGTIDRHTQRVYQLLDQEYEVPQKILEINPRHPLIHNLNTMLGGGGGEVLDVTIEQIYENALLLDGLHPNPAEMVERIQRLMAAATSSNHAANGDTE